MENPSKIFSHLGNDNECSLFFYELHVALGASAGFVLDHFGMMRTGVLMGVLAAMLVVRFLATGRSKNGRTECHGH